MKKKLSEKTVKAIEFFSWYGVFAILAAYLLVSLSIYAPSNVLVVFLNTTGSIAMLLDAWKDKNWQPVIINIVWIAIALVTLTMAFI